MRALSLLISLALPCAAVPVQVVSPSKGVIHRWITLPSRLEPNQQAVLHAKVGGHLKSIGVDVGDRVKSGQILARLEVPELEADRIRASAELEVARANAQRLEAAQAKAPGLVLPQDIDTARGRQQIAEAALKRSEVLLGYASITAPFDGVITARHADPGAFIPAGAIGMEGAVVTVADLSVLRARVPVPEQEARFIKTGTPARILAGPSLPPIVASVSRDGRSIQSGSATLDVEVDVPNAEGGLLAGSYIKTQLAAERHDDAWLIPAAALVTEKTVSHVFVVGQGKLVKTKVTTGFQDGSQVEILTGLKGDEVLVLVVAGQALSDGQEVTIVK